MQVQEVPSMFGSQKPDHNLEKLDCQGSASKFIFGVDLPPLMVAGGWTTRKIPVKPCKSQMYAH